MKSSRFFMWGLAFIACYVTDSFGLFVNVNAVKRFNYCPSERNVAKDFNWDFSSFQKANLVVDCSDKKKSNFDVKTFQTFEDVQVTSSGDATRARSQATENLLTQWTDWLIANWKLTSKPMLKVIQAIISRLIQMLFQHHIACNFFAYSQRI
jgi:hypothetical protein